MLERLIGYVVEKKGKMVSVAIFLSKRKKREEGLGEFEGDIGERHGPGPVPEGVE